QHPLPAAHQVVMADQAEVAALAKTDSDFVENHAAVDRPEPMLREAETTPTPQASHEGTHVRRSRPTRELGRHHKQEQKASHRPHAAPFGELWFQTEDRRTPWRSRGWEDWGT